MQIDTCDLVETCSRCNGRGWVGDDFKGRGQSYRETCPNCRTTGEVLTESGEALRAFVLKYCH